jgi:hypothetical protein
VPEPAPDPANVGVDRLLQRPEIGVEHHLHLEIEALQCRPQQGHVGMRVGEGGDLTRVALVADEQRNALALGLRRAGAKGRREGGQH